MPELRTSQPNRTRRLGWMLRTPAAKNLALSAGGSTKQRVHCSGSLKKKVLRGTSLLTPHCGISPDEPSVGADVVFGT